jgi:hypothetical protein
MANGPGTPARREAAGSPASPFHWRLASGYAREQGKNFPEDLLAGNGLRKRLVRHALIAVTAAVLVLADVAGHCQLSHDAVGASLGDAQAGRDVMQSHPRVVREKQQHTTVVTHEAPAAHAQNTITISGNKLRILCRWSQGWWYRDEDLGVIGADGQGQPNSPAGREYDLDGAPDPGTCTSAYRRGCAAGLPELIAPR